LRTIYLNIDTTPILLPKKTTIELEGVALAYQKNMSNREIVNELHGPSRKNWGRTISKCAWGEALKSKNANDDSQAMARIFKSGHGKHKNLQTDDGTEFFTSKFKVLMKVYE